MADQAQVQANDQAMDTMAEEGRGTDSVMAHLTNGEIVIPLPIAQSEQAKAMLTMMFELVGADIDEFTVGNAKQKINPETGHPEFGFFSSLWKAATAPFKAAVDVTKDVVNTTINVSKDVISGNLGQAGSDLVSGAKQSLKDAYTGAQNTLVNSMDALGILPKVPTVNAPTDSSPSTVTQGDSANQRQQTVTDIQAAAGGGSSSLTPRTVAGPDNDYKLNKSAVLGL